MVLQPLIPGEGVNSPRHTPREFSWWLRGGSADDLLAGIEWLPGQAHPGRFCDQLTHLADTTKTLSDNAVPSTLVLDLSAHRRSTQGVGEVPVSATPQDR